MSSGKESDRKDDCTICLGTLEGVLGILKCKHTYCFECIENWSKQENSCPLCKKRFSFIDKVNAKDINKSHAPKAKSSAKSRVKIAKKNQRSELSQQQVQTEWVNFISGLVGRSQLHDIMFNRAIGNYLEGGYGTSHTHSTGRSSSSSGSSSSNRATELFRGRRSSSDVIVIDLDEDETETVPRSRSSSSSSSSSSARRPQSNAAAASSSSSAPPVVVDLTGDDSDRGGGSGTLRLPSSSSSASSSSSGAVASMLPVATGRRTTAADDRDGAMSGLASLLRVPGFREFDEDEEEDEEEEEEWEGIDAIRPIGSSWFQPPPFASRPSQYGVDDDNIDWLAHNRSQMNAALSMLNGSSMGLGMPPPGFRVGRINTDTTTTLGSRSNNHAPSTTNTTTDGTGASNSSRIGPTTSVTTASSSGSSTRNNNHTTTTTTTTANSGGAISGTKRQATSSSSSSSNGSRVGTPVGAAAHHAQKRTRRSTPRH